MSDEQSDEQWTPEEWEEIRKHRAKFAEIQRRERLEGCVERVMRIYIYLYHHAEEGSAEQQEFNRLVDVYIDKSKAIWDLSRDEQEKVLEEYPRLIERLKEEHSIEW